MMHDIKTNGFRLDINGLRAFAVVAVVLFHFEIPGAHGGFIGVDIFFVISGFLMTGIILEKIAKDQFSVFDFYLARAKRIIPALAILCFALMVGGVFFLQAPDFKMLATHVAYSLGFLSNVEYWQESGYFDAVSHEKWLLHTWSLSVEWQFYIVLPLLLLLVWKLHPRRHTLLTTISVSALISLGLCVIATETKSSSAFYLIHYRAWEMLAGGLVFLAGQYITLSNRTRKLVYIAGLLLILASNLVFNRSSAWPGTNAILPVVATMLVIFSQHNSVILNNAIMQWLGDRSYSIYLWHWPIYVALVFSELRSNALAILSGLVLTLVMGHMSYILVENNSRKWLASQRVFFASGAITVLVLAAALPAVVVWRVDGWPGRFSESVDLIAQEAKNVNPRQVECHTKTGSVPSRCQYGTGNNKVIVLGDSHADSVITGVASVLNAANIKVEQMSYSACPFVTGMRISYPNVAKNSKEYQCVEFVEKLMKELTSQDSRVPVVLVNRYAAAAFGLNESPEMGLGPNVIFKKDFTEPKAEYLEEFSEAIVTTACSLAKNRTVYLMRPIPEMGVNIPKTLARRVSFGLHGELSISLAEYRKRNAWVWKAQDRARETCGVQILDPTQYLCSQERCFGSIKGVPVYSDDDHLSVHGSKLLSPMYSRAFKPMIEQEIY